MPTDERGLAVTAAGADAVRAFDSVIDGYLRLAPDTGARLKRTFAADPAMPMAHCVKGYFFHLMGMAGLRHRAARALAEAEAEANGNGATPRERAHIAALAAWGRDDMAAALAAWDGILADNPLDVLALRLAHHARFYLGEARGMADSVARVLPAWGEAVPGYGRVLGMHAFALEEGGAFAEAERIGRRAVALDPADPWSVHAVVHVCEMQDRARDGLAWLSETEDAWTLANNFRYHLWWHRALLHLIRGEAEAALDLYDTRLWDPDSDDYLDLCNDASLLARLEILGVDVGARWQAVAVKVRGRTAEHVLPFIDLHFLLALAAAGDDQAVASMRDSMAAHAASGAGTGAAVTAEVGLTVADAVLAWRRGRSTRAVALLAPVRGRLSRIGGSHAQRDLFHLILIDAARGGGRLDLARTLLLERTANRPGNPWSWRALAGVLGDLGDAPGAAGAEARAAALRP